MNDRPAGGRCTPAERGEPMKEYAVFFKDRDGDHISGRFNSIEIATAAARTRRRLDRNVSDVRIVERNVTEWTFTKGGRIV